MAVPVGAYEVIQVNRSRLDGNQPEQLWLARGIGPVQWTRGADVFELIEFTPPAD